MPRLAEFIDPPADGLAALTRLPMGALAGLIFHSQITGAVAAIAVGAAAPVLLRQFGTGRAAVEGQPAPHLSLASPSVIAGGGKPPASPEVEFGVAVVGFGGDGLVGVGDAGCFPVGGGDAGAADVIRAQGRGGVRAQDTEPVGEPGLGLVGMPAPYFFGVVVEGAGDLVRDLGGAAGGALCPRAGLGGGGEIEVLESAVQDRGDGPGAVEGGGGDPVDDGC